MIYEQVFINNGEIYKESRRWEGPVVSEYTYSQDEDLIWTFRKENDNGTKYYRTTAVFRKWLLGVNSGTALKDYDKCPDVTMWCGEGYYTSGNPVSELYFRVDNSLMLKAVADYYELPYPINKDTENQLDGSPSVISSYTNADGESLVLGSIKFNGNSPVLLKLYTVYKDLGTWNLFNKGRVFENGNVVEEGGMYYTRDSVKYISVSEDNTVTEYKEHKGDPITQWLAEITDLDTKKTKIEYFESSNAVRVAVGNLDTGSNYDDYDRAPSVNTWLGRSWIEGEKEVLYFLVENSVMLDSAALYYGLDVPYNDKLKNTLDNNIEKIRFKSYDLNNAGEGNFVPVVVAGVVFVNNVASRLRLYEVTRGNE